MVQRFQTSYTNQMQAFERLRTSLMDITQAKFVKYLRRRDHDGRLEFNHAERTLILHVRPKGKNNRDAQAVQDLKQLSGVSVRHKRLISGGLHNLGGIRQAPLIICLMKHCSSCQVDTLCDPSPAHGLYSSHCCN